jgi:hypothetical protein
MDSNIGIRIACLFYVLILGFGFTVATYAFICTWKHNLFKNNEEKIWITILFLIAAIVTGIVLFLSFSEFLGLLIF